MRLRTQGTVERRLREQTHAGTYEQDKSKLRSLDQRLAVRELESINLALINTITGAKRRPHAAGFGEAVQHDHGSSRADAVFAPYILRGSSATFR